MLKILVLSVELCTTHAVMFWLYHRDHGDGTSDAHKGVPGEALPVGQDKNSGGMMLKLVKASRQLSPACQTISASARKTFERSNVS